MVGNSIAFLAILVSLLQRPDAPGKLTVATKFQSSAAYVGQAVELQVAVIAGRERPTVEAPEVNDAGLILFGTETQPISVSAIGEQVGEQTVYRFRYRVIPRKPGPLVVFPFKATVDGRRGISTPARLKVNDVPREGRTADFLGGVGRFEVSATAKPSSIRVGQVLEFRIQVEGAAARGIRDAPSLDRLQRGNPGLRVERLPDDAIDEPPSHTFVWKLRPTSAGELRLQPAAVSAFDPKLRNYATKMTPGLTVNVSEVPRFDPTSIAYGAKAEPATPAVAKGKVWLAGFLVFLGVSILVTQRFRRRRTSRATWSLVSEARQRIAKGSDPVLVGGMINQALKDYLAIRSLHSTGALTPSEAKTAVERLTKSSVLGLRAESLIARTDRLSFGTDSDRSIVVTTKRHALRFLSDLAAAEVGSPKPSAIKTEKS